MPILKAKMPFTFAFLSAASTGIVSQSLSIDASAGGTNDWTAYAALYDEYKIVKGEAKFMVNSCDLVTAATSASSNLANICGFGYDPNGSVAPTSLQQICSYQQHIMIFPSAIGAGTTGASWAVGFSNNLGRGYTFKFKVPPGVAFSQNNTPLPVSGAWIATSNPQPFGSLQCTMQASGTAGSFPTVFGTLYLEVEFRCRN